MQTDSVIVDPAIELATRLVETDDNRFVDAWCALEPWEKQQIDPAVRQICFDRYSKIMGPVGKRVKPFVSERVATVETPAFVPQTQSALQLLKRTFKPMNWIIPKFLPEGCFLLAGAPKLGKSWLALQMGLSVAGGGEILGGNAEVGEVLYLALEDNDRRLQSRLKLYNADQMPDAALARLDFETQWPRLDEGGAEQIASWLGSHSQARLVIVDTLAKVRPQRQRGEDLYRADYEAVSCLKAVADAYSVALLIVHHVRKGASDDPLETISGTMGLSGAADGALILKRARGEETGELFVTGRDMEAEGGYVVEFRKAECRWHMIGEVGQVPQTAQQREALAIIAEVGVITPAGLARRLDKDAALVRQLLARMLRDGLVTKADGAYVCA